MNYQLIYNQLVAKAIVRDTDTSEYYEVHHIVPRCLGGDNSLSNLVKLTAREHFIAHLCLVRIYPGNRGVVMAAVMMACGSKSQKRSGNKVYDWLRRKHQEAMRVSQTGELNSQSGSVWIFNTDLRQSIKIKSNKLETYTSSGWYVGRVMNFDSEIFTECKVCKTKFRKSTSKTCSESCSTVMVGKFKPFAGREDELKKYYAQTKSMNKSLKLMGFPGAVSHFYQWAKSILHPDS